MPRDLFISYAQNFEDVMLWRALQGVGQGFYIDLGASEPDIDSVTRAFYDRGWDGINVEPAEQPFARLAAARPRDTCLSVFVGASPGTRHFFVVEEGAGLSTGSAEFRDLHRAAGWAVRETTVPATTLAAICEAHVRGPIHFLKVDVEGAERAVFEGANFARFRPWIITVEATLPNTETPSYAEWEGLLTAADYHFVYFDGLNRFYVAVEQHENLAPAFSRPPNVFDNFVRWREVAADEARVAAEQARIAADQARATAEQARAAAEEALRAAESERDAALARVEELERWRRQPWWRRIRG